MEANPHVPTWLVDQHLLAVNRDQIGSWLMRYWDMPLEICTAIRHQHDPHYDGEHHEYANLVYLSLALLRDRELGSGPVMDKPQALFDRLRLTPERRDGALHNGPDPRGALRKPVNVFPRGAERKV